MHEDSPEKEVCEDNNEFSSSPETTPKTSRKKQVIDVPKRKLLQEKEVPAQNFLKMLKKSPRISRPDPVKEEKPASPIVRLKTLYFLVTNRSASLIIFPPHISLWLLEWLELKSTITIIIVIQDSLKSSEFRYTTKYCLILVWVPSRVALINW